MPRNGLRWRRHCFFWCCGANIEEGRHEQQNPLAHGVGDNNPDFFRLFRPCRAAALQRLAAQRSEEHTSELQSLMRISYAVFCLKKKNNTRNKYYACIQDTDQHTKSETVYK